ncbi:putative two-component regulator [Campylobacter jejuni subsp. jejuni 414]|nr:putative two-component regulator [Campylobacter jejuni subsp. jejuni 414]
MLKRSLNTLINDSLVLISSSTTNIINFLHSCDISTLPSLLALKILQNKPHLSFLTFIFP